MSNSSIWPINRTLLSVTTPDQSGPGNNGDEEVFSIDKNSSITGASLSDCLVSYPGHLFVGSYPFAEMQSVYSTTRVEWDVFQLSINVYQFKTVSCLVGCVLWHINSYWLSKAKSCLYIDIEYSWFVNKWLGNILKLSSAHLFAHNWF